MKAYLLAASALLVAAPMTASASQLIESGEANVGIGLGNFNKDLGDITSGGFAWGARVGLNGLKYFGVEANYQHLSGGISTVIPVNGVPISSLGNYTQNSITGDVIAGFPIPIKEHELRPYAFGGIGYARLSANQQANSLGIEDNTGFAFPFGVGTKYHFTDTWLADARFTYNVLTGNKGPLANSGDSWILGVNVGATFGGIR